MSKMNVNFLLSPENDDEESNQNRSSTYAEGTPLNKISKSSNTAQNKEFRNTEQTCLHSNSFAIGSSSSQASDRRKLKSMRPVHHTPNVGLTFGKEQTKIESPRNNQGRPSPNTTTQRKPHACPFCDRSFFKVEQLKRHDRLVHLNHRPFVCAICDVSFGTKQNMQVHMSTRKHQQRLETLTTLHQAHYMEQRRK